MIFDHVRSTPGWNPGRSSRPDDTTCHAIKFVQTFTNRNRRGTGKGKGEGEGEGVGDGDGKAYRTGEGKCTGKGESDENDEER